MLLANLTEKNTCGIARFPCGSTAFLFIIIFGLGLRPSTSENWPRPRPWPRSSGLGIGRGLEVLASFTTTNLNSSIISCRPLQSPYYRVQTESLSELPCQCNALRLPPCPSSLECYVCLLTELKMWACLTDVVRQSECSRKFKLCLHVSEI